MNPTDHAAGAMNLVGLFDDVARARPDAPALVSSDARVHYALLRRRSDAVAAVLRARGVGPERTVGVAVPRSASSVAAVLGVLRAGGAYVPVDPAFPADRQRWIAADAGLRALLVDSRIAPAPAWVDPADLVDLATLPDAEPVEPVAVEPSGLLNVLYTSGSTGRPKGVCGTHGAMLNRLRWAWEALPFADHEVAAHRSALGFVDAGPEMFAALLRGVATAVIAPAEMADLARLVDALRRHRVTRVTLVPSILAALVRRVPDLGARLPDLRTCVASGEALSARLLGDARAALPAVTFVNLYGSTEVTGDATWAAFPPSASLPAELVPIGVAMADAELLVLDEAGDPSEVGELSVAGPLLARGYHRRPQEEAVRFRRHPTRPDARAFRTGDLVRRLPDGALAFLGRVDDVVKIRGVRVEPQEVERCLRAACPALADVAVVRTAGDQLVAFVTPPGVDAAALFAAAARLLPEVMRPVRYVAMAALPTLPNGKRDRRALAARGPDPQRVIAPEALPHTDTERRVADLWTSLLRLDAIARGDSFAGLGGDSLALAELMLALGPEAGVGLEFAREATLAELARALDGGARAEPRAVAAEISLSPLGDEGARDPAVVAMIVEASTDAALCAATELPAGLDATRAAAYCRASEGVVIRLRGEPVGAGVVQRHPNVGEGVEAPEGSAQLDEWLLPRWQGSGLLGATRAWPLLAAWLAERFDHEVSVVWEDHLAMLAILRARGYARLGRSWWTSAPGGDGTTGACEVWLYDLRPHRAAR